MLKNLKVVHIFRKARKEIIVKFKLYKILEGAELIWQLLNSVISKIDVRQVHVFSKSCG